MQRDLEHLIDNSETTMINREQLKREIDDVNETHIEILHRIILALKQPTPTTAGVVTPTAINPLKDSVTFEHDLISPIDISWEVEQ